jgi:hypothetical protein
VILKKITIYNNIQQMYMNEAYGKWTKEETNWSSKDTEFVQKLVANKSKAKSTTLSKIEERQESLSV